MGTNFYMRRAKPILCFPEFHIAKRSYGWKPLFESNGDDEDVYHLETERPVVHSIDDVRGYVESGEWVIVDEYGTEFEFDEFMRYLNENFRNEGDRRSHRDSGVYVSVNRDGTEWYSQDFS